MFCGAIHALVMRVGKLLTEYCAGKNDCDGPEEINGNRQLREEKGIHSHNERIL